MFESSTPLIHKLHSKQIELFRAFLGCFIDPKVLLNTENSANKLKSLDIEDCTNHLPNKSIFIGDMAKHVVVQSSKSQLQDVKKFKENTIKAYVKCAKVLQKRCCNPIYQIQC